MSDYRHGTIWTINFEPQVGSEITKVRPDLIISKTEFNLKRQKITVIPFTSQTKPSGRLLSSLSNKIQCSLYLLFCIINFATKPVQPV